MCPPGARACAHPRSTGPAETRPTQLPLNQRKQPLRQSALPEIRTFRNLKRFHPPGRCNGSELVCRQQSGLKLFKADLTEKRGTTSTAEDSNTRSQGPGWGQDLLPAAPVGQCAEDGSHTANATCLPEPHTQQLELRPLQEHVRA